METLVVARNSLMVLLLALPSLYGSAGVWQFPAYGPSPRPLEAPTPRVARAAIPKDLVSDIHCLKHLSHTSFSAVLRLPPTVSSAAPVVEGGDFSNDCRIAETSVPGVFQLELESLAKCGVRECTEEGEPWLCLLVRYPVLRGLRLPEDEVIDIKCKPQVGAVMGRNAINFQENMVEHRSPAIFTGGGHEFVSEIGLFRQLAGTQLFAARVKSGAQIELGENVQLRSIVRSGDGWGWSKLTDVIIQRVRDGIPLEGDAVKLVHSDGCRDPDYSTLAPYQPWGDETNSLVNNFDFRVFMFADMQSGDSVIIKAQVVACVDEVDCTIHCQDGIRRRRSTEPRGRTEGWQENLELKVTLPTDSDQIVPAPLAEGECRLYLIVTLATALTFCVLSACIVLFACFRRWRETAKERAASGGAETASIRSGSSAGFKTAEKAAAAAQDGQGGMAGMCYFVPYCSKTRESSRPVTVRSVKRRDRGKSLDRERREREGSKERLEADSRAVMV